MKRKMVVHWVVSRPSPFWAMALLVVSNVLGPVQAPWTFMTSSGVLGRPLWFFAVRWQWILLMSSCLAGGLQCAGSWAGPIGFLWPVALFGAKHQAETFGEVFLWAVPSQWEHWDGLKGLEPCLFDRGSKGECVKGRIPFIEAVDSLCELQYHRSCIQDRIPPNRPFVSLKTGAVSCPNVNQSMICHAATRSSAPGVCPMLWTKWSPLAQTWQRLGEHVGEGSQPEPQHKGRGMV